MSIVTLKRKTLAKYNNNSVNSREGFSLNGTHRSQGYIGQTSLSRSFPTTPMKGNVAKGHGGCCGKYRQTPIIQSAVVSLEDPTVVKSSSINTLGLISTKYRWVRRPQPYSTTSNVQLNNNTQGDYIKYIQQKTLKEKRADGTPCHNATAIPRTYTGCANLTKDQLPDSCPQSVISAPDEKTGAINYSDYLFNLDKKCVDPNEYKIITMVRRTPFSCSNSTFR